MVLRGSAADCIAAALTGGVLGSVVYMASRIQLNDFCTNGAGAFLFGHGGAGAEPVAADRKQYGYCHYQCCHASCARRDIHNSGQGYAEWGLLFGAARMLEAIVTALAVAAGVGASMALFHQLTGGGTVW